MIAWQARCRFRGAAGDFRLLVLARSSDEAAFLDAAARLGRARGWQLDERDPLETAPVACPDPAIAALLNGRPAIMLTGDGRPMVHVSRIAGVAGLDAQFGQYPKRDVPQPLEPLIFGAPGRFCYALLDGAKIEHLPQMLAGALLDHDSLFQGKAQDELAEVAPYLVRLERGNPFTRRLFTKPGALGGLWGGDGGILLLSQAPLADIRKQLRKYTRIRDEDGKWYYYRFWEPRVFRANAVQYDAATFAAFLGPVEGVLCPDSTDDAMLLFEPPQAGAAV